MKIQSSVPGVDSTPLSSRVTRSDSRSKPEATPAETARDGDTVRIDPRASLLAAAETALQDAPTVDMGRVEEIKQAIAQGRFEVDSAQVADRLLGTVRDLLMTRSA